MHTYRVTVITAAGQRVELPFIAANQQQVYDRLDEVYPDRLMSSCMCTSRQPHAEAPHPDRLHRVVRLLASLAAGALVASCGGGDPDECEARHPPPPGTSAIPAEPCAPAAR